MNPLKLFRNSTGLSQDNMARRIGVSLSMYEKVERGNAKPSRGFTEKIKISFPNASIDDIFFNSAVYEAKYHEKKTNDIEQSV